ncbi:adenylate/guanylate cyclase domain-containing protein [Gammaproteobacteria bacterium]|nr:adenylate/guanylate cyclase domain-containing protein [Gammaproteobacteria bacterium]
MNKKISMLVGFILLALITWIQISDIKKVHHVINDIENIFYDWSIRTNLITKKTFKSQIVIVDIDDQSLAIEGRWPWSRDKISLLLEKIQKSGAIVVSLDFIFPQEQVNIATKVFKKIDEQNLIDTKLVKVFEEASNMFDYDNKFGNILASGDTIVGFAFTPDKTIIGKINPPLLKLTSEQDKYLDMYKAKGYLGVNPVLAKYTKNMGFVNYIAQEGVIRQIPLIMEYNKGIYPSLALETARLYFLSKIQLVTAKYADDVNIEAIKVGGITIPVDQKGQVFIPFRGPSYTFPYYSATKVLNNEFSKNEFEDKIVYVGTSATGLSDLKPTSVSNIFPGVEIQATITDGILKNDFSYRPAWGLGAEVVASIAIGLIVIILYPFLGARILIFLTILIPLIILYINHLLLQNYKIIISMFFPILFVCIIGTFNIIYGYLFESRHRKRLHDMFGQYVPKEHINEMMKTNKEYDMHGESRNMTVLFSDIRGFTKISETMDAEQLKLMLNEIFTPLTEVIFNTHGTIDKYIGDCIMAFWGAPLTDKGNAEHAITAAIEMQKVLVKIDPLIIEHGWPHISIGIGINTGKMTVGDMGSKYRKNYTVLGDEVNLASRVESLTKFYGVNAIAAEESQKNQNKFLFRKLDKIQVVGKKIPTIIYEIIGYRKDASNELQQEIKKSNTAFELYLKKEWSMALSIFKELNNKYPQTKYYSIYIDRCNKNKKNPPPVNWDGTFKHTSK